MLELESVCHFGFFLAPSEVCQVLLLMMVLLEVEPVFHFGLFLAPSEVGQVLVLMMVLVVEQECVFAIILRFALLLP